MIHTQGTGPIPWALVAASLLLAGPGCLVREARYNSCLRDVDRLKASLAEGERRCGERGRELSAKVRELEAALEAETERARALEGDKARLQRERDSLAKGLTSLEAQVVELKEAMARGRSVEACLRSAAAELEAGIPGLEVRTQGRRISAWLDVAPLLRRSKRVRLSRGGRKLLRTMGIRLAGKVSGPVAVVVDLPVVGLLPKGERSEPSVRLAHYAARALSSKAKLDTMAMVRWVPRGERVERKLPERLEVTAIISCPEAAQ